MDADEKLPAPKQNWLADHPRIVICAIVVACLSPFLNKAVEIDDPLFVWTAKWIQHHPGNFFGFNVNWFGVEMPMGVSNYNPPTTSYFLALVGSVFGWEEIALHGAFLLIAIVAALGVFALAHEWCGHPLLATVVALLTPVFLVSGTTLMSDMPMFAGWIWAVVMWEQGLKSSRLGQILFAGFLTGVAVLTKYSALNNLAWLLASHSDAKLRDGAEAVRLATRAAELTGRKQPVVLGTLAAAFAETGQFKQAIETAEAARNLAAVAGQTEVVESNERLLKLYRAGKAAHQAAGK
ncbi:MAG: hypothetical protein EXS35_13885 [Pedosphaera sp.]|nr:hypothetical protein [Pedosphaera sp.]